MTRRLRCGQAIEIGGAIATIITVGLFYMLLSEAWDPLKSEADTVVTNSTAQETVNWMGFAWEWYLAFALGIIIIGTISAAAYQRQGGRL